MSLMGSIIGRMSKEKKEEMMIEMMPMMMDGLDMNSLMPRMIMAMLNDLTAEQVVDFLKGLLAGNFKVKELGQKAVQSGLPGELMKKMMFITYKSALGFEETVAKLREQALKNNWNIPDIRDIQNEYSNVGITEMTKLKVLYFCMPHGGFSIIKNDPHKMMSVMMPMGVSVYEKGDGSVEIAGWNLQTMSGFFPDPIQSTLQEGARNFNASLNGIIEDDARP